MFGSNQAVKVIDGDGNVSVVSVIAGYIASEIDASSPAYYGFERPDGAWYIMKETISGSDTTYTFAAGTSGFATAWTNRATQSYDTVSATF